MGKSYTYHVIGISKEEKTETGYRRYETYCMTKLEMAQKAKNMRKQGTPVVGWFAQTKTGNRMLGADYDRGIVPDSKIRHIKTIECPICKGTGGKSSGGFKHSCPVCSGSGITKKGYWNKWADWQIEQMKLEFCG